ncbi:MAG: cytochrome c3 family protein [Bacillota bacterium]|nr:cytochrome c3 family protein [Bacillota bacterium]
MHIVLDRRLLLAAGFVVILLMAFAFSGGAAYANMTTEQCMSCHSNEDSPVFVDVTKIEESVHAPFSCSNCHVQITTFPHNDAKAVDANLSCGSCHADAGREFNDSVHGKAFAAGNTDLGCSSCHDPHNVIPGDNPESPVNRLNVPETCASCHEGTVPVESYADSFHGIASKFGSTEAAQCADCHGTHNILGPADPASTVAKANVPDTCAQCHNVAQANFANGPEHYEKKPYGDGAPMYWTLKFFTWLTILTITLLIIHIELDLYRRLKEIKTEGR